MKIGIDLKPFSTGSKFRGIGMYSRELIKELLEIDEDMEFSYLNLYTKYENDPLMNENCDLYEYYTGPKVVDVGERQLYRTEELDTIVEAQVKNFIQHSKIDVMFFTSPNEYGTMYKKEWFKGVFTVGILYDLIPLVFPKQCLFDPTYKKDYERTLDFIKGMDLLLAISQSAKDDAVKLLGIPEDKIVVIYAGIDSDFRKLEKVDIKALKDKYGISDSFILFAGGIDFKKNIEGLIEAYCNTSNVVKNKYQLVITGKASPDLLEKFKDIARANGVDGRVICTGYISKKDLIEMYNTADLLVFPSLYEGFGLPVIEAMACGTRVITSDCSSLREIAKGHATLVNPKSVKSITKGIEYVFNHPIETLDLAENSIDYANSFTWKKVAELTKKAIINNYYQKNINVSEYKLEITKDLIQNISKNFILNKLSLDQDIADRISDELYLLSKGELISRLSGKERLIYDVTVVKDWLKARYGTGIGRVSKELFNSLSRLVNVIPVEISGDSSQIVARKVSMTDFSVGDIVELNSNDIFLMPELQLRGIQVKKNHPNANMLRTMGIKCYAIVYDILPLRMPEYFERKTSHEFAHYIKELVECYDGIICDSKTVADDVISYCEENHLSGKPSIQIAYNHLGANSFKASAQGAVSAKIKSFMQDQNIFFMLGTIEPRKGHQIILNAFEKMWEQGKDVKLCIVGHVGWNMNRFVDDLKRRTQNQPKLAFFEAATDAEVEYIYKNCTALIQASAGEGFGLPLIEASNYNVPILCSDIAVFHEVAGDNAVYFNRNDEQDIISKILNTQKLASSEGIHAITWSESASNLYQMLFHNKNWYREIKGRVVLH